MALTVLNLVYTVTALFVLQKLVQVVVGYIRTLLTARRVHGLPGTSLILGDMQFETFDDQFKFTQAFVRRTGLKVYSVWMFFFYPFFSLCHPDTAKQFATFDDQFKFTQAFVRRTGVRVYKVWMFFFYPYYSLCHPDTAKLVFTKTVPKTDYMGNAYRFLRPWIGEGLLGHAGGWKWERNRKLLTPAFHFEILKNYATTFNNVAEDMLIQLSKQARGKSVEVTKPVTMATLDALLRCAFSYHGQIQELGRSHPYVEAVHRLSQLFIQRITNPILFFDPIYRRTRNGREFYTHCDYVHTFAEDIIAKRRADLVDDVATKRRPDFLDILLKARDENGQGLTDLEIRAEADTFLFAGHDTTSSAISFGFYALARYPEEQERVYQEVREVVGDGPVEWDHLPKLKHLLAFIKEVMRMYSTVPFTGRVVEEPLTIGDVTLPKGTPLEINIDAINHRPDVWPDHEEFRPDRFYEHDPDRDPFTYVPFSAGSRNCIGQNFALNEQKVILARLVQTFRLEVDSSHKMEVSPSLVMRAKHGLKVFLHSR